MFAWWSRLALGVYGLAAAYDFFTSQFASDWPRFADGFGRLSSSVPLVWWIVGLLVILLLAAFEGGYRQVNALARAIANSEAPYSSLAAEAAVRDYYVGGEDVPGDELFVQLAPQFSSPVSDSQIERWLYMRIRDYNQSQPETPISGEVANNICRSTARDIIQHWYVDGLLDSQTIHHPGTIDPKTGHFRFNAGPRDYAVYTLSARGRDFLAYLTKQSTPDTEASPPQPTS